VEQVYERLEPTISPEFEERLAAERTRQKKYHSTNAYSLGQFGIDPEELADWLAPVLERFGFSREGLPQRTKATAMSPIRTLLDDKVSRRQLKRSEQPEGLPAPRDQPKVIVDLSIALHLHWTHLA
jgi:hypothetical protein